MKKNVETVVLSYSGKTCLMIFAILKESKEREGGKEVEGHTHA